MATTKDKHATRIDILQAQALDSTPTPPSRGLPTESEQSPPGKRKTKRNALQSPEFTRKIVKGPPQTLELPRIAEPGSSIAQPLIIRNESPWDTFKTFFTCDLAGTVFMAQSRLHPSEIIAIRAASTGNADKMLKMFKQIKHDNIISATVCYQDQEEKYFVVDDLLLTLEHQVASDAYPNEAQLATILGQVRFRKLDTTPRNLANIEKVLDGIAYLLASGYQHQRLTCSNILMGLDGKIKIGMNIILCSGSGQLRTAQDTPN